MNEAKYLDELERRADAYIEALAQEGYPLEYQQRFQNMCDVFTVKRLIAAKRELDEALRKAGELQRSFDLRWKADRRATEMWQRAHPGNDLVWPDHADMVVWLLEQLDAAEGLQKQQEP